MKNLPVALILSVAAVFTSCEKESALNGVLAPVETPTSNLTAGDRDLCSTGDCNWQIVVQGVAPENSKAVLIVQRYDGTELECEQTYSFEAPICNTCWQTVPMNAGSKLRIVANVFSENAINPHGTVSVYVKKAGMAQAQKILLGGGGTTDRWFQNASCGEFLEPIQVIDGPLFD